MRISHIGWSFAGLALPLLVAVATIPNLLSTLGPERFGLLTLAWGLIGYAGALDLGIGRATTLYIARLKSGSAEETNQIPTVLSTALRITFATGAAGAIVIALSSFTGMASLIKVQEVPFFELKIAILLLALALPMQAISATYRGVNEAYLNFKGVSVLRVLLGIANFGLPSLIAAYTVQMDWIILSLVLSRALALHFYRKLANSCIKNIPQINSESFSPAIAKNLLKIGGWFTLSGLLNPMVATADRFFISILVSAAAVSIYIIPYEMIAQSLILVGAVTTVTYPYFAQLIVSDPSKVRSLFLKVSGYSLAGMLIVSLVLLFFGTDILTIWLGKKIPEETGVVVKILSIGLLPYTIGTLCVSLLHAYGRTETTAKLSLIEFPLFICMIYFLVGNYGVIGAALAWAIRVTLDAIALTVLTLRQR